MICKNKRAKIKSVKVLIERPKKLNKSKTKNLLSQLYCVINLFDIFSGEIFFFSLKQKEMYEVNFDHNFTANPLTSFTYSELEAIEQSMIYRDDGSSLNDQSNSLNYQAKPDLKTIDQTMVYRNKIFFIDNINSLTNFSKAELDTIEKSIVYKDDGSIFYTTSSEREVTNGSSSLTGTLKSCFSIEDYQELSLPSENTYQEIDPDLTKIDLRATLF